VGGGDLIALCPLLALALVQLRTRMMDTDDVMVRRRKMRTATHTRSREEGVCREQTRQGNTQTVCHVSCFTVWMSLWVNRRACEAKKKKKLSITACTLSALALI
jgi:hypothetical protein